MMLCQSANQDKLDDPTFGAELKADGTHIRLTKSDERIRIFGRPKDSGIPEYTSKLTELIDAAVTIPAANYEIVGEAVVYDENGRTWFEGSQRRCSTEDQAKQMLYKAKYPVVLLAFDLTELDGKIITSYPWEKRKELLDDLLRSSRQKPIQYLPHTFDRRAFFKEVTDRGEEGVILKKVGSPYIRTRNDFWLKVKKWYTERCLVVGYTDGTGTRERYFGSLILAQADDSGLKYVGKVGTGFNKGEIRHLSEILKAHRADVGKVNADEDYHPVDLSMEVTVKFYEMSKNGVFRFPSMLKDDQDRNFIHYEQTIKGRPQQLSLKDMLQQVRA